MGQGRHGHVLATVLFTDIVDSSKVAHELGDRRWRILLARHHAIVRKALKRHRGKEIDNAGDGFFASFGDQVEAIRCACAISNGVRTLGIDVRAGLHVGQAEIVGKKLGGVVVHTGARVMSEADAGEVLISSVMKELVPGSGFTFEDRGAHHLKGIEGEWRLFAVTSVDGTARPERVDPVEAARLRESIKAPPLVERRSGHVGIVALAVLVAIGTAFLVLHRSHPMRVRPNSLVRIDATTNEIVADIPVADPGGSQLTEVPPNEVWVLSGQDQVISIVDTQTNEVHPLGVFGGRATTATAGGGIVYAFGRVWVTGADSLVAVSSSRTIVGTLSIPGGPSLLAAGYGRIWVTIHDKNRVIAIDPETMEPVLTAEVGTALNGIGVGENAVWVSSYAEGTISKVDPNSGTTTTIDVGVDQKEGGLDLHLPGGPATIATGFGSTWVSDPRYGVVYRIDPATNEVMATIRVGEPDGGYASDIAEAGGAMWVASPRSKTIVRIDPSTNSVAARIPVPYTPNGLTATKDSVWVTINP